MNTKNATRRRGCATTAKAALGKIGIVPTKPYHTQYDLSLAYSPGVAAPSLAIAEEPDDVYKYTGKGNLVAVISNGTAVPDWQHRPPGGKPVMEGKSMLFKTYAGIDAFDIEVDTTDPEEFIRTVKAIAPHLREASTSRTSRPRSVSRSRPACARSWTFPLMHDDQHGTAIISSAALLNGAKIAGKRLDKCASW